jgi:CDGSH-type Zn-finger protein
MWPYYLLNDTIPKVVLNLKTSDGKPLSNISGTVSCRCGASKNKPFCDGTHGTIRFLSDNKKIDENGQIPKDKKKSYPPMSITAIVATTTMYFA